MILIQAKGVPLFLVVSQAWRNLMKPVAVKPQLENPD